MASRTALIATGILGIALSLYYFTQLPERVAIHFGGGGVPDSWASSGVNLAISIFLYAFLVIMFIGIPSTLKNIPLRFISLPNKEYWLTEERKESTIKLFSGFFSLFGTALIIFFLILGHLVFMANMSDPVALNESVVWISMGCILTFTIVWLIMLLRKFRLPA